MAPSYDINQDISFYVSNNATVFANIKVTSDPISITYGKSDGTESIYYNSTSKWNYVLTAFKTIRVTSDQEVSEDFYNWFISNIVS